MADENGSYDLDEDSSLEKFEEELLSEEKKKARSNFLLGILVLLIVVVIGFYGYTSIYAPNAPAPRKQMAKAVKPPVPAATAPAAPLPTPESAAKMAPEPAPMPEPIVEEKPPTPMPEIKEEPLGVEMKIEEIAPPAEVPQVTTPATTPKPKMETAAPEMTTEASDGKRYTLQVGFFKVSANAENISKRLRDLNLLPQMIRRGFTVQMVKVYVGEFLYKETAAQGARELSGFGFKPEVALTGPGKYELEVGRFDTEAQADSLVKELEEKQIKVRLDTGTKKIDATMVRLVDIDGTQRLEEVKEILKREKIAFFMVRR